jgi:hypothetical protein
MANHIGGLDDRVVVGMLDERWAHLHAQSNPSRSRNDDNGPSSLLPMAVQPEFLPRRSRLRPEPTYVLSSMRSTQTANHPVSIARPVLVFALALTLHSPATQEGLLLRLVPHRTSL